MFKAISFDPGTALVGIPEIVRVQFDLSVLCVSLEFEDQQGAIDLAFERVGGFRVLDEGQLSAFWSEESRADGWLWEVTSGGWYALESTRDDFVMGLTPLGDGPREFIVLGVDYCVSVITWAAPRVQAAEP